MLIIFTAELTIRKSISSVYRRTKL